MSGRDATLTWLGQATFLIETGEGRLLIDPFFSEHPDRRFPPPPVPPDIDRVLVTHEHLDHLDPDSLRRIGAPVIAPAPLSGMVEDLPFQGVAPGDEFEIPGGTVRVVPAIHAVEPGDGYTASPRFVGYVMELGGVAIYHAGDTIAGPELEGIRADVALLPVNGRTYFRERQGLAGNLGVRDAAALAEQVGARVLVPIHWDLMEGNTERAGAAADAAAEAGVPVHVMTLRRGVPWTP
jgi:L-ascorbate metabolism protein UlaG (beta-lactamase superfamily)